MNANSIIVLQASELEAMIKKIVQGLLEQKEEPAVDRQLTVGQVCKILQVNRTTLWRWEKAKFLVPIRLGGRVYYNESQLSKIAFKYEKKA